MSIYAVAKRRYFTVTWGKTHTFNKIYLMVFMSLHNRNVRLFVQRHSATFRWVIKSRNRSFPRVLGEGRARVCVCVKFSLFV